MKILHVRKEASRWVVECSHPVHKYCEFVGRTLPAALDLAQREGATWN